MKSSTKMIHQPPLLTFSPHHNPYRYPHKLHMLPCPLNLCHSQPHNQHPLHTLSNYLVPGLLLPLFLVLMDRMDDVR